MKINDLNLNEWQELYHTVQYATSHAEYARLTTNYSKAKYSPTKTTSKDSPQILNFISIKKKYKDNTMSSAASSKSDYLVRTNLSRTLQSTGYAASQQRLLNRRTHHLTTTQHRRRPRPNCQLKLSQN